MNSIDAVVRVEVLHNQYLKTRSAALARCNDRPGEKELPDLLTVRFLVELS